MPDEDYTPGGAQRMRPIPQEPMTAEEMAVRCQLARDMIQPANKHRYYSESLEVGRALLQRDAELTAALSALRESVKLQSHYAGLLNMHDGGKRMRFPSAQVWMRRLAELENPK